MQDRDISLSYAQTLLGQRSLAPVSPYCVPRLAAFDDALDLFTLPDTLILCDNLSDTEEIKSTENCKIFTVGSVNRLKNYFEIDVRANRAKSVSRDYFC